MRRAVELGDAWSPFRVDSGQVRGWLDAERATDAWAARDRPLDVVVQARHLDPIDDASGSRVALEEHADAGATLVAARFRSRSVGHALEQLAALRELAGRISPGAR